MPQGPANAVLLGRGVGKSGFSSAAPGTGGTTLISNGTSSDATFQQPMSLEWGAGTASFDYNPWTKDRDVILSDTGSNTYAAAGYTCDDNIMGGPGHHAAGGNTATAQITRTALSAANRILAGCGVVYRHDQTHPAETGGNPPLWIHRMLDITRFSGPRMASFSAMLRSNTAISVVVRLGFNYGVSQKFLSGAGTQTVTLPYPVVTDGTELDVYLSGSLLTNATDYTASGTTLTRIIAGMPDNWTVGVNNILVVYHQGTGGQGSPSAEVYVELGTLSVTTTYQTFTINNITIPDELTGKTLARDLTTNFQSPLITDFVELILQMPREDGGGAGVFTLDIGDVFLFNSDTRPTNWRPSMGDVVQQCRLFNQADNYPGVDPGGTSLVGAHGGFHAAGTATGTFLACVAITPPTYYGADPIVYSTTGASGNIRNITGGADVGVTLKNGGNSNFQFYNTGSITNNIEWQCLTRVDAEI